MKKKNRKAIPEWKRKALEDAGAKVHDPETGRVEATYYLGDVKSQVKSFQTYTSLYNAWCQNNNREFEMVADDYFVKKCLKRISKHYGLHNKYNGDGTRKNPNEVVA